MSKVASPSTRPLILPGADPEQSAGRDPHDVRGADPTDQLGIRFPEDCPGLRIVRIIERDASREVPHVFGRDDERPQAITQGLFALHDRLYYGLAPKPVQGRGPIALTKCDPTTPRAAHRRGWNTNAVEIIPAFLQPGDDPAEWAMYVQALRTAHLHTNVPTRLPLPLHPAPPERAQGRYRDREAHTIRRVVIPREILEGGGLEMHDFQSEPFRFCSEIGDDGYEVRKV
ncbi:RNaseH domain-containing protein [Streptomyces sp. NPDC004752]